MTIYVGNLPYQATEEDLREVFAEYGAIKRVSVPADRETGRARGFAFVEILFSRLIRQISNVNRHAVTPLNPLNTR